MLFGPHKLKTVLGEPKLQQRLKKSERGLRALIFVRSVGVQTVATTAGRRIVNRTVQIVAPEEPLEDAPRLLAPAIIAGDPLRLQAGGNHRLSLHGLLVEACAGAAAPIKPIGPDGNEMT